MYNDIFISLPGQSRLIISEDYIVWPIKPDFDQGDEDEDRISKRNLRIKRQKMPRKPNKAEIPTPRAPQKATVATTIFSPTTKTTTTTTTTTTTRPPPRKPQKVLQSGGMKEDPRIAKAATTPKTIKEASTTTRPKPTIVKAQIVHTTPIINSTISTTARPTTTSVTTKKPSTKLAILDPTPSPSRLSSTTMTPKPVPRLIPIPRNPTKVLYSLSSTKQPATYNKTQTVNISKPSKEINNKDKKMVFDKIKKIMLRRNVPVNDTLGKNVPFNDTETEELLRNNNTGQSNYNLNARIQYYDEMTGRKLRENFEILWTKICELHNKHLEVIRTLIRMDPTHGVRAWLNRQDLVATHRGEVLSVSLCQSVTPHKIYWDNKYKNQCFKNTPVEVGNKLYFVLPGSKDLIENSTVISCAKRVKPIFRSNESWYSDEGVESVLTISEDMAFRYKKASVILKAESP